MMPLHLHYPCGTNITRLSIQQNGMAVIPEWLFSDPGWWMPLSSTPGTKLFAVFLLLTFLPKTVFGDKELSLPLTQSEWNYRLIAGRWNIIRLNGFLTFCHEQQKMLLDQAQVRIANIFFRSYIAKMKWLTKKQKHWWTKPSRSKQCQWSFLGVRVDWGQFKKLISCPSSLERSPT